MTSSSFDLNGVLQGSVTSSSSFWGGLSGTFSITNSGSDALNGWRFSFISTYKSFDFYNGVESAQLNSDGTYTITVQAAPGASPLGAGATLDLGFTVTSDSYPTVTLAEVVLLGAGAGSDTGASSGGDSAGGTGTGTGSDPGIGTGTGTGTGSGTGTGTDNGAGTAGVGLGVDFQLGGSWSGTYEGTVTVRNTSGAAVPAGWSVTFISDHALRSISDFTVQQRQLADGRHEVTLSAASWASSQGLAAGASVSSYFQASGNLNGQNEADLFEVIGATGAGTDSGTDTGADSGNGSGTGSSGGTDSGTEGGTDGGSGGGSGGGGDGGSGSGGDSGIGDTGIGDSGNGDSGLGGGGAIGGGDQEKRLVGYFEEWGIYGRDFRVADVRAEQLTHLNYSFFGITPTQTDRPTMAPELNVLPGAMVQAGYLGLNSNTPGGLGIHDTWAAYEKTFTQADQLVSRAFKASEWQGLSAERQQEYLNGGEFDVSVVGDGSRLVRAKADTWADSQGGIQRTFSQSDWDGLSDERQADLVNNAQRYTWTDQWQGTFNPGSGTTAQRLAAVDAHFAAGPGRNLTLRGDGDLVRNSAAWVDDDPSHWQKLYAGNLNQLRLLKELNPELSIGFAVGGWTLSGNFSTNLDDATGREIFTQSILDHLEYYDFFSTVDFDWEYPGGGGLSTNASSPEDGSHLALTLELLDQKLASFEQRTGREIEISIATAGGADKLANLNLQGIDPYVDFYNVMAYDFHGGWEGKTGHQAAMTGDTGGYDVVTAVDQFRQAGIAMDKVVLGAPAYTRGWGGVVAGTTFGYGQTGDAALAPGSYEKGNYDHKDLITGVENGSYQLVWDDNSKAAFAYNPSSGIWSSMETTATIAGKAAYVEEAGLGGMMFWALSNDSEGPQSLIGAAHEAFSGTALDVIAGRAPSFDQVLGGNGVFSFSDFTTLA
ncbi:MAG: glycosyl hydrolase family 18 protein [Cyanobacteriota bacterium]